MPITVNLEIIDEQPSWRCKASTEKLHLVSAGEPQREVKPPTTNTGGNRPLGSMTEGEVQDPTTDVEWVASPAAHPSEMGLGASI